MSSSSRTDTGARAVAVKRIIEDALTAYLRLHRINAHHPAETSVWNIPTTLLAPEVATRLAVLPDGTRALMVNVEVAIEVEREGRDWSVEMALLTVRMPTPQRYDRMRRERILRVTCDDSDVTVDQCSPAMAAFGATLPTILMTLANGQYS